MATADTANYEAVREDVAALKKQMSDLLRHTRDATAAGTRQIYDDLHDRGERTAEMASAYVRDQPLASVAIAFAVGCLLGRMMR